MSVPRLIVDSVNQLLLGQGVLPIISPGRGNPCTLQSAVWHFSIFGETGRRLSALLPVIGG